MEQESQPTEKYCPKHPNKRTKFFCENEQINICSKCIVLEHKGHNISDVGESRQVQVFQRRAQILKKKIDASRQETAIFAEELAEIEDQLQVSHRPFITDPSIVVIVGTREHLVGA